MKMLLTFIPPRNSLASFLNPCRAFWSYTAPFIVPRPDAMPLEHLRYKCSVRCLLHRRWGPSTPSKTTDSNLDLLHRTWSVKGQQYKIELMTRPGHIHFSLFDTSYNSTAFFEYFQLPPQSQCAALWKEEFGWKTALKIAALYEEGKEHDKVSRIFSPIYSNKRPPRQLRLPWHAEIPLEWLFNHLQPVQCNLTNF